MQPQLKGKWLPNEEANPANLGDLIRTWRKRKDISQMVLALECGISTRHLSFIECGRSIPSRGVILKLGSGLGLDQVAQNRLLTAAGLVPEDNVGTVNAALDFGEIDTLLRAVHPVPALALDPRWNIVGTNPGINSIFRLLGCDQTSTPNNFLRLCFRSTTIDARLSNANQLKKQLTLRVRSQIDSEYYEELNSIISCENSSNRKQSDDICVKMAVPFNISVKNSYRDLEFIATFSEFICKVTKEGRYSVMSFFPSNDFSRNYFRETLTEKSSESSESSRYNDDLVRLVGLPAT